MAVQSRYLKPAVWGFYVVVVLEFLFMISPAALHFYSAYGPALNIFHHSSWTSWLTGFFLPHFSRTGNIFLDALKPLGFLLAAGGVLLFAFGAVQIYGAKLLRRGAVKGGLYKWVRHPQYSALAVLGLGVVLIWPRFLVLLSFVTMLFMYGVLARWEEKQCLAKYGDSYRDYRSKTGRFLPRVGGEGVNSGGETRWPTAGAAYGAALAAAVLVGFGLQSLSLSQVSAYYAEEAAVLSPAVLTEDEIFRAYRLALSGRELVRRLNSQPPEARYLAYVVPQGWYLPDLPLHTIEEIRRTGGGHATPDFERARFQVLFTRARLHGGAAEGAEIVRRAFGRDPILIVEVDLESGTVLGHREPPEHVVWGDIPTPLF